MKLFIAENNLNLAGVKKKEDDQFTTFHPKVDNSQSEAEFNLLGNSIFSNINNMTQRTDGLNDSSY